MCEQSHPYPYHTCVWTLDVCENVNWTCSSSREGNCCLFGREAWVINGAITWSTSQCHSTWVKGCVYYTISLRRADSTSANSNLISKYVSDTMRTTLHMRSSIPRTFACRFGSFANHFFHTVEVIINETTWILKYHLKIYLLIIYKYKCMNNKKNYSTSTSFLHWHVQYTI